MMLKLYEIATTPLNLYAIPLVLSYFQSINKKQRATVPSGDEEDKEDEEDVDNEAQNDDEFEGFSSVITK